MEGAGSFPKAPLHKRVQDENHGEHPEVFQLQQPVRSRLVSYYRVPLLTVLVSE